MQQLPVGDLVGLMWAGAGGFGSVYRGKSQKMGMEVAWKVLHGVSREELLKEAALMHKANHTYILRVLSTYISEKGELGLVMEYMPHGTLRSLLDKVEGIPWALRFQILHQVALGMNYLHHVLEPPILHRDLKPDNVLLDRFLDVKLTDFGLARNETSVSTARDGAPGTVVYMPPEALKEQYYKPTKEFDVYSFAILTWSVLSGKKPYDGVISQWILTFIPQGHRPDKKLVELWRDEKMVPEAIEMMQQCWHGDPRRRPSFFDCKDRTERMNEAYAGEIHDARNKVLNQLKTLSQETRVPDTPDGETMPDDLDPTTEVINRFAQSLNATEPSAVDAPVVSEVEPDIRDAKAFLRKNYSKLVQGTPEMSSILDELYAEGYMTEELLDTIRNCSPAQEQVRKTLRVIMSQGQASCKNFVRLMWRDNRSLMRDCQQDLTSEEG